MRRKSHPASALEALLTSAGISKQSFMAALLADQFFAKPPEDGAKASRDVDGFCARNNISRSQLYDDWRKGRGPRYYTVGGDPAGGGRRRITPEAERDWIASREAAVAA